MNLNTIIQGYQVGKFLGGGSFANVYSAVQLSTRRKVAFKMIQLKKKTKGQIKNINQQIDVHMSLQHPHIIPFMSYIKKQTHVYIITELAATDLGYRIKERKNFNQNQVREFGRQIISALRYLHNNKIVHRDLKPHNIMISFDEKYKLGDFGFAKVMSPSTAFLTSYKGTPLYLAPQILQSKGYNHKVDIWSLGVILYELFCGKPPFYSKDIHTLFKKISHDSLKFPETFSPELRDLISGMLKKQQSLRSDWPEIINHPFFKTKDSYKYQDQQEQLYLESGLKLKKVFSEKKIKQQETLDQDIIDQISESNINDSKFIQTIAKQVLVSNNLSEKAKSSTVFYLRFISIIGKVCQNPQSIGKNSVLSLLKILIELTMATKKYNLRKEQDFVYRKQFLGAIIKLIQTQHDIQIQAEAYCLLGYGLKASFDSIRVDFSVAEQLLELSSITLKNYLQEKQQKLLSNCLTVFGTMITQAFLTLEQSQQFFYYFNNQTFLQALVKCFWFDKKNIVIEVINRLIWPLGQQPLKATNKAYTYINQLRIRISQLMINNNIFSKNSILMNLENEKYMNLVNLSLKISRQFREQFISLNQETFLKKNNLLGLISYITVLNNNSKFISYQTLQLMATSCKELEQSFIKKVFSLKIHYEISLRSKQFKDIGKIVQNVCAIYESEYSIKIKSCLLLQGTLLSHYNVINDQLIGLLCDIVLSNNFGLFNFDRRTIELIQKTLIQSLTILFEKIQISQKTLLKILSIKSINLSQSPSYLSKIQKLFDHILKEHLFQFYRQMNNIYIVRSLIISFLNIFLTKSSIQSFYKIIDSCEKYDFMSYLFSEEYIDRSQEYIYEILQFINAQIGKLSQNTINLLAVKLLPHLTQFLKIDDLNFLSQIINTISYLGKIKKDYYQNIEQCGIVQYIPKYLTKNSNLIIQKSLNLIGNLSKHSSYFFQEFNKHNVVKAAIKIFINHQNNQRIYRNGIYAFGNLSYHNQMFKKQIIELVQNGYFNKGFIPDERLALNTICTISNLLRHSSYYLRSLIKVGLLDNMIALFKSSEYNTQRYNLLLSLISKAYRYKNQLPDQLQNQIGSILMKNDKIISPSRSNLHKETKSQINPSNRNISPLALRDYSPFLTKRNI